MNPFPHALTAHCFSAVCAVLSGTQNFTKICKEICCPPGSSVHGIFQARILEWVAISFSRGSPDPGFEPSSLALKADSSPVHTGLKFVSLASEALAQLS